MQIGELFGCHGVIMPMVCMQLMVNIFNLEAIIRKQKFWFMVNDTIVVIQFYKPLKMHGLLKYGYGILGLKGCIQLYDAFDGNIILWFVAFMHLIL